LFGEKLSWHEIIYDLINTEQLDPWDINLSLLADKYLEKVKLLEEANFFVSSKVLLAAALLLRMKSEILLNDELPSLDAILFGKKEEAKKYSQERIELDDDIPGLVAKTPLPRYKKVTLEELMKALNQAITTENRRIKKIVVARQQEFETALFLPKQKINIKDKIREVYEKLLVVFKDRETKLAFTDLAGENNENRIATFIPLLHLDNQQKVWLEQENHFEEIWILLKHLYEKQNATTLAQMRKEVEEEMSQLKEEMTEERKKRAAKIEADFENPLGDEIENVFDGQAEAEPVKESETEEE
jgi:segregation and condensation protein A